MEDRELLELAAKAAGLQVKGWIGDKLSYFNPINDWAGIGDWNPLTDDGDALRLAFHLGFSVDMSAMIIGLGPDGEYGELEFENLDGTLAEVRRSIVRAAAEIGRSMP